MVPDIESNFYIKQDKFITNVVIKAYNSCHDIIKLIKEYHNQILINNSSGVNYNGIISLVDEEYNRLLLEQELKDVHNAVMGESTLILDYTPIKNED